jgi:RNase P subunit RPR2
MYVAKKWTCKECGEVSVPAVGMRSGYDRVAMYCLTCLKQAIALLEEQKGTTP